jgi:hypothetical protein
LFSVMPIIVSQCWLSLASVGWSELGRGSGDGQPRPEEWIFNSFVTRSNSDTICSGGHHGFFLTGRLWSNCGRTIQFFWTLHRSR